VQRLTRAHCKRDLRLVDSPPPQDLTCHARPTRSSASRDRPFSIKAENQPAEAKGDISSRPKCFSGEAPYTLKLRRAEPEPRTSTTDPLRSAGTNCRSCFLDPAEYWCADVAAHDAAAELKVTH